ncbi:hypothetical protein HMI56_002156 [Coelomomyces lativittatus]|nr:hypothetical protein HMI56_002156 [Coelomomyces lativittatus]
MFGPFRSTNVLFGGRQSSITWKLSPTRKANVRKRLRAVDDVVATIHESGLEFKALIDNLKRPTEKEMNPKNKYWVYSPHHRFLMKGVQRVPKFTKTDLPREWPIGIKRFMK